MPITLLYDTTFPSLRTGIVGRQWSNQAQVTLASTLSTFVCGSGLRIGTTGRIQPSSPHIAILVVTIWRG